LEHPPENLRSMNAAIASTISFSFDHFELH
jgi:hypothetical protein